MDGGGMSDSIRRNGHRKMSHICDRMDKIKRRQEANNKIKREQEANNKIKREQEANNKIKREQEAKNHLLKP